MRAILNNYLLTRLYAITLAWIPRRWKFFFLVFGAARAFFITGAEFAKTVLPTELVPVPPRMKLELTGDPVMNRKDIFYACTK